MSLPEAASQSLAVLSELAVRIRVPVWAECSVVDLILMVKGGHKLARGSIPELGTVIRARCQDPSTVRTKCSVLNATLMVKGSDELARGRIPELSGVVPACGQNPSTVRAKGPVRDLILMNTPPSGTKSVNAADWRTLIPHHV